MFGINSINGSFKWLGVPDFLRNDGPPWTVNILAPYPSWGEQESITNPNWVSFSGGHSKSVSFTFNRPVRVFPIYHRGVFENMISDTRRMMAGGAVLGEIV